ncbi:MAG TPA: hypothetical protein VMU07_02350 [Candidatus Paceibacterota bacterium]|nr:hypothetical protein [Candidatus Paceibacterota bacterium]
MKIALVAVASLLLSLGVLGQDDGSGGTNSTSTAGSTSTSNNTLIMNSGQPGDNRQIGSALPGTTGSILPGGTVVLNNQELVARDCFTVKELEFYRKHNKRHGKVDGYVLREAAQNDDLVCLMPWWPGGDGPKPSKIIRELWVGTVLGENGIPPEALAMDALYSAKKSAAHVTGCAVRDTKSFEMVTKEKIAGLGGSGGGLFGNANKGTGAVAVGYSRGSSRTRAVPWSSLEVNCPEITADVPVEWAPQPPKPEPAPAPPVNIQKLEDTLNRLNDTINRMQPAPQPAPVAVVEKAFNPWDDFPAGVAIYFDLDDMQVRDVVRNNLDHNAIVVSHNRAGYARWHAYLQGDKRRRIQWLGGASIEGPADHNTILGMGRVRNVYTDYLTVYPGDKPQICVYSSQGKEFARKDKVYWKDRNVYAKPDVAAPSAQSADYCSNQ